MQPSFPIEEVARIPLPGLVIPGALAFSPDGRWISYLFSAEGSLVRQLYKFNPDSGAASVLAAPPGSGASEENLSPEEKLRRERQRQYELGITSYAWSPVGETLLIPLTDGLYIQQDGDGALRRLASSQAGPILDPQFSPDGAWVAYVQNAEIYAAHLETGETRQLTTGRRAAGWVHGLAEFIAQEEMGRRRGFWWSPDSRSIAFEAYDETHIPVYRIMHQGKAHTGPDAQEDHRYPFVGERNVLVRLGVVALEGGDPTWMDLGDEPDIYLARVDWLPDGGLTAQIENRAQDELRLIRFDPLSGQGEPLLTETSEIWINLNDLFKPLKDGRFIWGSERSGFRHLYLYEKDGSFIGALTQGEWTVECLAGVDEDSAQVYFTGTLDSPLETHLYAVSLSGGSVRKITQAPGTHAAVLDVKNGRFIDTHDALDQPPVISLRNLADNSLLQPPVVTAFTPNDPRTGDLTLRPPEIVSLENRAGVRLYGALFRPEVEFGPGPYPTIVIVYGGPHVQLVANSWRLTVAMRAQYLRGLGFLVFVLDNRGSNRRGLAFEGAIKNNLGDVEVQDQVDGVNWLVQQGLADPQRIGITGWSYGGYMTLMCLLRAPQVFKAGVAGAPVSDFSGYDTHYTERYMGTPSSNPAGYRAGSPLTYVENLRGNLLLVHGLIDENVHFRHTARLINGLIRARKPYDLLLFPDERHGPRRLEDRIYLEERLRDFFIANLNA